MAEATTIGGDEWDVFPEEEEEDNNDDEQQQQQGLLVSSQQKSERNQDGSTTTAASQETCLNQSNNSTTMNMHDRSNNNHQQHPHEQLLRAAMTCSASAGVLYLMQHFCKTFHMPLTTCRVAILTTVNDETTIHHSDHDHNDASNRQSQSLQLLLLEHCWNKVLNQRGILSLHTLGHRNEQSDQEAVYDVILVSNPNPTTLPTIQKNILQRHLVPGGLLLACSTQLNTGTNNNVANKLLLEPNHWSEPAVVFSNQLSPPSEDCIIQLTAWSKLHCSVNTESCRRWLPSKHSFTNELTQLQQATVALSAAQAMSSRQSLQHPQEQDPKGQQTAQRQHCKKQQLLLSHAQHQKAIHALNQFGYCILRQILSPTECQEYGQAVLQDLHLANTILQNKYQVDVYQPHTNPDSYRELSMREDLRMDLRDGPHLRRLRGRNNDHHVGTTTTNNHKSNNYHLFWQQPDLVYILQQVMYPRRDEFRHGNFGRYNFDGIPEEDDNNQEESTESAAASISLADESYPLLKLSAVGGIISLPGAADQAIHADTPHLFEHDNCLPAHYINAFTPGCYHDDDARVGGTALIHGSHQLSFTAKYCPTTTTTTTTSTRSSSTTGTTASSITMNNTTALKDEMYSHYLVRPWLQPGDVLLFDCRILHFGVANLGVVARPMMYTNITHAWFHDPKNWNDRQAIFDDETEYV